MASEQTERVMEYVRLVAEIVLDDDEAETPVLTQKKDDLWELMSQPERDAANALVNGIFKQWL